MTDKEKNFKLNNDGEDYINLSKYIKQIFKNKKIFLIGIFSVTFISGSLLNRSKPIWQGGFQFLIKSSESRNTSFNQENIFSNFLNL